MRIPSRAAFLACGLVILALRPAHAEPDPSVDAVLRSRIADIRAIDKERIRGDA